MEGYLISVPFYYNQKCVQIGFILYFNSGMSKKFYVIYSLKEFMVPKVFKTKATVNKYLQKNSNCIFKQFYDQDQAYDFSKQIEKQMVHKFHIKVEQHTQTSLRDQRLQQSLLNIEKEKQEQIAKNQAEKQTQRIIDELIIKETIQKQAKNKKQKKQQLKDLQQQSPLELKVTEKLERRLQQLEKQYSEQVASVSQQKQKQLTIQVTTNLDNNQTRHAQVQKDSNTTQQVTQKVQYGKKQQKQKVLTEQNQNAQTLKVQALKSQPVRVGQQQQKQKIQIQRQENNTITIQTKPKFEQNIIVDSKPQFSKQAVQEPQNIQPRVTSQQKNMNVEQATYPNSAQQVQTTINPEETSQISDNPHTQALQQHPAFSTELQQAFALLNQALVALPEISFQMHQFSSKQNNNKFLYNHPLHKKYLNLPYFKLQSKLLDYFSRYTQLLLQQNQQPTLSDLTSTLKIYLSQKQNPGLAVVKYILITPRGEFKKLQILGVQSTNESQMLSLWKGLQMTKFYGERNLKIETSFGRRVIEKYKNSMDRGVQQQMRSYLSLQQEFARIDYL